MPRQLNNIFTINPTTVLTVRYGFNRFPNFDYNSSQGFNIASAGFNKSFASSISPAIAEFPQVNMTSIYSLGRHAATGITTTKPPIISPPAWTSSLAVIA